MIHFTFVVRRARFLTLSIVAFLLFFYAPSLEAKDLQGRVGLGYNAEWANTSYTNGVPGISLKYGLSRDIGVEAIFGVATSTPGNSVTAIKFLKNVFFEQNLNFYFTLGGGILSADARTGSEFLAGFGAEFFIPGVDSLGFAMESGVTLDNLSGSFIFRTLGVSFLNAGIHFYF